MTLYLRKARGDKYVYTCIYRFAYLYVCICLYLKTWKKGRQPNKGRRELDKRESRLTWINLAL